MKKFYTIIVVALLAATISASAQNVILRIPNNYEVKIDDRYYGNNETVPSISYGQHTVQLYEVEPGFLGMGKKRKLLSSSSFNMRNNDVIITSDQYGQLRINDAGNNNNKGKNGNESRGKNDNDDCQKHPGNKNGKGYGKNNNPGRGHKYGHYKKDHDKKYKHDKDKDDDDHDD